MPAGNRDGSGSSPTHSMEPLRRCASCSISMKVMSLIVKGGVFRIAPQCPAYAAPHPTATHHPGRPHAGLGPELAGDEDGRQQFPAADFSRAVDRAGPSGARAGTGAVESAVSAAAPALARTREADDLQH